ncbi:MAG: hypothetical protein V3T76_05535, partial [candidate division NC10 bacterium]
CPMAKQNRLLDTKTVRLNKLGLNVRYTELGGSTHPLVLLLHGAPAQAPPPSPPAVPPHGSALERQS